MKKIVFYVYGSQPLNPISDFMKKLDLGIEGIYTPLQDKISGRVPDDFSKEQVENAQRKIVEAYEHEGCKDVEVVFVEMSHIEERATKKAKRTTTDAVGRKIR